MYVIHLIIQLNILGVMIDNTRFVLYCIVPATLTQHLCQRSYENKSLISNQSPLKNDPPPHFLENYFAEVKIKKLKKRSQIIFKRELI